MKVALLLWFLAATSVGAEERLLDFEVAPGPGDRFQRAVFSCWLPSGPGAVKSVIIHQHGCPAASPEKQPPITTDWHWRALAQKYEAALLVPMYQVSKECSEWNDPEGGSERALFAALEHFAGAAGRGELRTAPWLLWGHSGGSSWSAQMIVRHPERVLAASFRGGCHQQFGVPEFRARFIAAARMLPMIFIWGRREAVPASPHYVSWLPMNTMFCELRQQGGHVTRVIDPSSEHDCNDSRLLSMTFFAAVLSGQAGAGTFADLETLQDCPATKAAERDPALTWMPNAEVAAQCREFSESGTLRSAGAPSLAPVLQAERVAGDGVRLTWQITPEIAGGLGALRILRDGQLWKEIGLHQGERLADARDNTPASLRVTTALDESGAGHSYTLKLLDAAGRESPASPRVRIP